MASQTLMLADANCPDADMSRKSNDMILAHFLNDVWLPAIQKLRQSWTVDQNIARTYISPALGEKYLQEVGSDDILKLLQKCRREGRSPTTRNRILSVLRSIFAIAAKKGYIDSASSPVAHISNEALPPKSPRLLEPEDLRAIIYALEKSEALEAKFLHLMLLTNAGKGELLAAKWEDFSPERKTLTLKKPIVNGSRSKEYLLSPKAMQILESLQCDGESPWIFPGTKPELHMYDIYYFWNNLRRQCGFPGLKLHDLQMNFVVCQIREGGHPLALSEIFGYGFTFHARKLAAGMGGRDFGQVAGQNMDRDSAQTLAAT